MDSLSSKNTEKKNDSKVDFVLNVPQFTERKFSVYFRK